MISNNQLVRRVSIIKVLAIHLFIFGVASLQKYEKFNYRPLMNAFASDTGVVIMNRSYAEGTVFNVDVDFASPENKKPGSNYFPFYGQMRLALYTSETVLFDNSNCFNFLSYYCGNVWTGCEARTYEPATASFINFDVSGYKAQLSLALDYNYWSLKSPAIIANNCSKTVNNLQYDKTYGLIGLGTTGEAYYNMKTDVFSIYVNRNISIAMLIFKKDSNYAKESQPLAILPTNGDWHLSNLTLLSVGKFNYTISLYRLLFDLNSDSIGISFPMYEAIIQTCLKGYGVLCPNSSYIHPTCQYQGLINMLPNITYHYGNQQIVIPPEIYVYNAENTSVQTSIRLKFKALSHYRYFETYMSFAYLDHVVLGQPFFKHYYTVFNRIDKTISLYTANHETKSGNSSKTFDVTYFVIIGVVICILFCCFKGCCKSKPKKNLPSIPSEHRLLLDQQPPLQNMPILHPVKKQIVVFAVQKQPIGQNTQVPVYQEATRKDSTYYAPRLGDI